MCWARRVNNSSLRVNQVNLKPHYNFLFYVAQRIWQIMVYRIASSHWQKNKPTYKHDIRLCTYYAFSKSWYCVWFVEDPIASSSKKRNARKCGQKAKVFPNEITSRWLLKNKHFRISNFLNVFDNILLNEALLMCFRKIIMLLSSKIQF